MSGKRKGIWIPKELIEDHKLDWSNKILLSEIASLNELEDGCIASNNHFARLLGLRNASSASKRISKLERLGFINTQIVSNNRVIVGRKITLSNAHKNNTIVPKTPRGSSTKSKGVVPSSQQGGSLENTINTVINSSLLNQEVIHNIGENHLDLELYSNNLKKINSILKLDNEMIEGTVMKSFKDAIMILEEKLGSTIIEEIANDREIEEIETKFGKDLVQGLANQLNTTKVYFNVAMNHELVK
jgi:hypothetical protein